MIELQKAAEKANDIAENRWVRFTHMSHGDIPCPICLALDGCCFVFDKKPKHGDDNHKRCHCEYVDIPPIKATVEADIRKFTLYAFVWQSKNDKSGFFLGMGYTIEDSEWLRQEYIRQAKMKYEAGEYRIFGDPNKYGQKINVRIVLINRITGKEVSFDSGWMVKKDGGIELITPYGDD